MKTSPLSFVALAMLGLSVAFASASAATVRTVKLTLSPTSIQLLVGQSRQFTAFVLGPADKRVGWLVNGIAGGNSVVGTITSSGLYTAPSSVPSGSVTIRAQSAAAPTVFSSASVNIKWHRRMSVSVSPAKTTLQVNQSQQFTAYVLGTDNKSVSWSVSGIIGGNATVGTISSSGWYTAPSKVPSSAVVVSAQSLAVPSASGSATVSIQAGSAVAVSISPTSASLQVKQSKQFNAVVTGTTNTAVRWLVNGTVGGNATMGTISSSGIYTAPVAVPSGGIVVTAQSAAQPTASASATVSVTAAPVVSVSISPTSASLQVKQSKQFNAVVSGTTNTAVQWLVNGLVGGSATMGTISSSGMYTAPVAVPSGGIVVTAQSAAQPTVSASATVAVTAAPVVSVSISPTSVSLQVKQSKQFNAVVSGTTNTAVQWLVNGLVGGNATMGTISSSGMYTAPVAVPSGGIVVAAQSAAQPTVSASATVSVTAAPVVTVSISPTSVVLQLKQSKQFNAVVSGTTNTAVNWLVNGLVGGNATMGTISSSGMYTAPVAVTSGGIVVTAQSAVQPTASASATVSLAAAPVVTVSVSPTTATLQVNQTQQFNATVSGTSSTGVNWLVNGLPGGNSSVGTISSSGLYTAPVAVPTTAAITITAQSSFQPTATANASVSVLPVSITVSISPTNASVLTGQTQQFRASVSGTSNTAVKWLVSGILGGNASVGTISAAGLYTAPSSVPTGSVTVTAQSAANSSSSATASVSVAQPVNHSVSLSWTASSSSIIGYYIYRSTQPNGPFTRLNSSPDPATVYTDSTVVSATTYYYTTTSVNSSGTESGHSNTVQAVVP